MTNEEKNWVNEELGKVEDIPEEQVEKMVDEIPHTTEDETSSNDPFEELAHVVRRFAVALKDNLSNLDERDSIVFGIGLGKSRYAIVDGSSELCKNLLFRMADGIIKAEEMWKSERGEHED